MGLTAFGGAPVGGALVVGSKLGGEGPQGMQDHVLGLAVGDKGKSLLVGDRNDLAPRIAAHEPRREALGDVIRLASAGWEHDDQLADVSALNGLQLLTEEGRVPGAGVVAVHKLAEGYKAVGCRVIGETRLSLDPRAKRV